jgi:hypothetical protein
VAGVLSTFADVVVISDFVVVVAIVIAIIVGALFVSGRIAPRTESTEHLDEEGSSERLGQVR